MTVPSGALPCVTTLLRGRGLMEPGLRAIRHTLNAQDRSDDFPSLAGLVGRNLLPVYERMQDGRRLGHDNALLSFVAEPGGLARLVGYRRVFARRKGLVPGDIVYDYEAAPLLHSFISRARCPVFYDSVDLDGLGDLFGRLVVRWPAPLVRNVLEVDDSGLAIVDACSIAAQAAA
jgi:hypothetical protein